VSHAHTGATGSTRRKCLKTGVFVRGAGLAIKGAVFVCAAFGGACLVPQSVEPIVTVPHPPPHFVLDSIRPELFVPQVQLYSQGSSDVTANCHCELELAIPLVEEDDPTVVLEARWFVDYDPAVPLSQRPYITQTLDQGFDTPSTIRPLNAFNFSAEMGTPPGAGHHLVEILIGEKAGFDPATSVPRPNQWMLQGYSADIFRFAIFVTTTPDPGRPTCAAELPTIRVCR
jgi:hypothetical protein